MINANLAIGYWVSTTVLLSKLVALVLYYCQHERLFVLYTIVALNQYCSGSYYILGYTVLLCSYGKHSVTGRIRLTFMLLYFLSYDSRSNFLPIIRLAIAIKRLVKDYKEDNIPDKKDDEILEHFYRKVSSQFHWQPTSASLAMALIRASVLKGSSTSLVLQLWIKSVTEHGLQNENDTRTLTILKWRILFKNMTLQRKKSDFKSFIFSHSYFCSVVWITRTIEFDITKDYSIYE